MINTREPKRLVVVVVCVGGGGGLLGLGVVVVLTLCLYDVSVHATKPHTVNSGGRSPGSQTPGDPATPFPP